MSFIDDLVELLRQNGFNVARDVKYKSCCSCECCSKPQQPTIPDVAPLVKEVLENAGIKIPAPEPMEIPPNMVTIFDGPYAGLYGLLGVYCRCGCSAKVFTKYGIVVVSVNHIIKHH
jgi:hypothetical protein